MAKIVGQQKWMLIFTGTIPPGIAPEAWRSAVGNGISISAALMGNVDGLSIVADTALVENVMGILDPRTSSSIVSPGGK